MEVKDIISSGLLELYILGLTSSEETIQVERWAKQHYEVSEEIEELQFAMETYASGYAMQPDVSVKQRILSSIVAAPKDEEAGILIPVKKEKAAIYRIPSYSFLKWAMAACIVLLIGSIIINFTFYNKYQSATKDLQVAQQDIQHQKEIADAMNKDMSVMGDKNALPVALNGTPHAPNAAARIYWMKNTGDVYVDPTNLPQTPSGMQYQLWAIVDGKPVDAGMISAPTGTYHIQKMKSFGKAEAFAITLEKAGGSPTPSMDQMYVMAKI